jgi:hypothetical protein
MGIVLNKIEYDSSRDIGLFMKIVKMTKIMKRQRMAISPDRMSRVGVQTVAYDLSAQSCLVKIPPIARRS